LCLQLLESDVCSSVWKLCSWTFHDWVWVFRFVSWIPSSLRKTTLKTPSFPFQNTSFIHQSVSPSARPVSSLRPSFLAAAAVASGAWSFHVSLRGSRLFVQLDATIQKHCKTKIATILSLSPLSLQVVPVVVMLLLVLELLLLSLSLSRAVCVCVCVCVLLCVCF
jgi:hypothetical protein